MCRHHISIDLESVSGADISKTGSYRYMQDPDFRILLFGYQIDDGPVEVIDLTKGDGKLPQKIVTILQNPSYIKHAYNAAFEWYALNRAGYPTPIEHWQCTMVWSLYCGYAAGLANTGEAIGLPEDKKKNLTGKALIRYFCTPQKETKTFKRKYHVPEDDPDKWELFIEYNRQDVVAEYNILQRLKAFPVPESEWELWRMDIRMNALGVKVDTKLIRGALEIDAQSTKELTDQAVKLTGLANPNSQAQLLPWLQEHGCDITDLQKLTVEETLQRDDLSPEVREVLRLRQLLGKTSIKKYVAMETAVGEGDRVRGISQFYGANRTGRYCLTGDHEVLTPNGWVRLDEWEGGRILCWEPTMEKLSFQKSESLQFDYSGPMYHYEGQRISQVATPDHKMAVLAKDGTWEAKTVKEIDIHRFTIPFTGKRITDRPYRDDQIRVLIMTQADGFYTDDGGIKYNFAKKRKVERCKSLLRKCGITFVERTFKKGITCITIPWRYAPLWLRQFRDKTFGYWLLDENLSVVMEELPEWDGYRCGPNSIQYATTNEINADVIQTCALCNGMSATKATKKRQIDNWSTAYYVNIWLTPGRGTAIRREQVSIEEMNEIKVYCAKTPTGYFAVRRNGRIWITGNSGRLVQLQNLPRNYLSTLDAARRMVREGNYEAVRMIYGNVPDTLSQLIRTAFIPSEGRHFVVADFSAIEARMIAWMAGEQWVSDVFARGDDIYCETASAMFGVPVGKHGPNAELRQKGKIATLALGYQGGPAAMIAMGALRMGIPEEDLPDIVTKWRKTHPKTVAMWYQVEEVMVRVVSTGVGEIFPIAGGKAQLIFRLETDLVFGQSFLTIELPVGRKLFYPKPYLKENKFGKLAVHYYGVAQATGKWGPESTYGGRGVENIIQSLARDCLCEVIRRIYAKGWDLVFHVHDEVIIDVSTDVDVSDLCALMDEPINWAPGLLLKGAGFTSNYYMKD